MITKHDKKNCQSLFGFVKSWCIGHTFICAQRLNISQRYFCPWRAAVIFRKKLNVMSLLKRYLRLLYLYFVYIYWKYVLWLHLFKALEQLNFYFVKKSCLMNVLSKYVGPEKIVCSLSSKMEKVVCRPLRSIRYYKVWNRLRYCKQWIELNRLLLKIIYEI
jgi:hypothetical protein